MTTGQDTYDYTEQIKGKIKNLGADLVGVADTEPLKQLRLDPPDLIDSFQRALSIALSRILDQIAFHAANLLQRDGFNSIPIPASQVLDREHWYGAITHKAVGRMAGLGWQGKSLLLVNPDYGPRIRLATVLTDAPLNPDGPIENRCGDCTACRDACPVGAIKGVGTKDNYETREEALYFSRCAEKLAGEFSKLPNVGSAICGICIKACPYGQ